VSDQKRKRGRPPGASKFKADASNHEAPEHDAEPDPEDSVRPKKRGRKTVANASSTESEPSRDRNGPVQPRRAGRPPKNSQQTDKQGGRAKADKTTTSNGSTAPSEDGHEGAPKIELRRGRQQSESSKPRRSGRVPQGSSSEPPGSDEQVPTKAAPAERRLERAGGTAPGASKDNKSTREKEKATAIQSSSTRGESSGPRRSARGRRVEKPASNVSRPENGRELQAAAAPGSEKSRTRANGASQKAVTLNTQQNDSASKGGRKHRGRPPLNTEDPESVSALEPQQGNRAKASRKSSEAGKSTDESRSIQEPSHPKRRGRPRKPDAASIEPEPAQPVPRGRQPRRSREAADEHEQGREQSSTKSRRKKQQPPELEPVADGQEEEDEHASSEEDEQELPFRYLKESTKNIPRSVISEKWNALDGPSISAVGAFLADAQRPVLLRLQNTSRRREHASAALSVVSRRLHTKLVKGFPFPAPTVGPTRRATSGSHENEFDLERAMNAVQGLENTLNPLLHSVSLLEREIKKEEDALSRDYDDLHKLEINARSEVQGWREKAKREHVLASGIRGKGEDGGYGDEGERLELVAKPEGAAPGGLFQGLDDEELMKLSQQLGSHMESMQGNLQQIGGVIPAISKSKAALQRVMLKHLGEEQYDKVLLG
jgi:hypothetical protein